ncbi:Choline/Carnitine o-acyltransferase-domain-containing protein [Dichotomopilus funicola]|uniref:Choline/Carnitine o-acyltransferase-domain-containing protein n=1 Tax=Dichotomopilus funicola TaxID=1934379 RepID=A0AAN6V167_9PEZI|nr:Choline/Carnitine o-acyltransferase-domain-containing protein [Dichotomopilus funicola]
MPTQVRIFTSPRSLGETLSSSSPVQQLSPTTTTPRSVPDLPIELPTRPVDYQSERQGSTPAPMSDASHEDKPKGGVTYAHQDDLPKLPIPDLESSLDKYLAALKPLQSAREHAETKHAVQAFLRNEGPELNEKLKKYAEARTSYIEQFWYDSYLNFDNPVVLNLNPFFLLEDDPTPARNNQVTRAASLVVSALEFVRAVRKEELPADTVKGTPLCMYQYSRLFGTARVPTDAGCQIEQDPESKHVVAMCHGQFYWFDVLDENSDLIMTERDIAINLQTIIDDAAQTPIQEAAKGALGVLSTENRKVWSGLRDVLTRDPGSNNADCLGIVDTALFVICLDYSEPATAAALCQNMLCGTSEIEKGVQIGTCTNRWYDKLQIIVCKNGSAGINFEHTGVDGHTVLRFVSDLYTDTILRFARTINGKAPTLWASTSPDPSRRDPESFGDVSTLPHKLEWDMAPELRIAVRFAETRLADLIEQNEFQCLDFGAYGKTFITSMGFSPDAFVQMAFQAAYYGLYGRVECTYEPAMTKMYLHGRTEAIRTVTDESVRFVQTFWADNPAEQKIAALRRACQRHVATTRECAKAQGCDRHLYALFCLWQRTVYEESVRTGTAPGSPAADYASPSSSSVVDDNLSDRLSDRLSSPPREPAYLLDASPPGQTQTQTHTPNPGRDRNDSLTSNISSSPSLSSSTPPHPHNHHLPALFADPGWDKLNTTILSTSNCGNPSLRQFGFGPVSGDGFGIGYIIKDEGISICVSSRHRQTRRFVDTLESYLLEIRRVLRIVGMRGGVGGGGASRAREVDGLRGGFGASGGSGSGSGTGGGAGSIGSGGSGRTRLRGRLITGESLVGGGGRKGSDLGAVGGSVSSPTEESLLLSEDDELGGYGFFDAGMLLQALKARGEKPAPPTTTTGAARVQARRREVGRKLRLVDY